MKLKELHSLMQDIEVFDKPKVELEQYPTGPHLASRLLFTVANSYDEFSGRTTLDLGCGTGMLAIGAALLGSTAVVGVDVDQEALQLAQENAQGFEGLDSCLDWIQLDLRQLAGQIGAEIGHVPLPARCVDTVIMNPPFGTRSKGADMDFLRVALHCTRDSVYSLHKSSTREHIRKTACSQFGAASAEVLAELRYDLPATYQFHKQKSKDIQVDLWRFEVLPTKQ